MHSQRVFVAVVQAASGDAGPLLRLLPHLRQGDVRRDSGGGLTAVNYAHLFRLLRGAVQTLWQIKDAQEAVQAAALAALQAAEVRARCCR